MALNLSIFTTSLKPTKRGDNYKDAIACYRALADEVINVRGESMVTTGYQDKQYKTIRNYWPVEFDWPHIGKQFQKGYEACSGDWVIHADLDFLFHEKDFDDIRAVLEQHNDMPALSFYKYQFVLPDRYNLKSRLVIAVNKGKFGDRIRFDSGGDLAQPSLDGRYISPDSIPQAKIGFYNYEKLTKTKEQISDDVGRMERAYERHFGHTQYGSDGTNEDAFSKWYEAQKGKMNKPQEQISIDKHPKFVQETIKNLKPEQFGYNGFGLINGRVYG